jgi:hypothetical protein
MMKRHYCTQMIRRITCVLICATIGTSAIAQWQVVSENDARQDYPNAFPNDGKLIRVGDQLPHDQKFRWLIGELEIPESIGELSTAGQSIGLQIGCGDGGEVYVDGKMQGRYDNDHPLLAILADKAVPGSKVHVAIQVFGMVQGGGKFDDATLVVLPKERTQLVTIDVNLDDIGDAVPNGLIGLSQGGGMSDYQDATAAKLKEGGFKWFRTDNVLTNALKKDPDGNFIYDWTAFDERVDFIHKTGAAPILAVSYMSQVLDAVPDDNRQSAPNDYAAWEELCYQAAKRCLERGKRVPFWEVWNEPNSGWIKAGPQDAGGEQFTTLYRKAVGKEDVDHEIVRRFEAYAKVYRATARGVLRADPTAKVGGPALASGPLENSDCGHCTNGKGFARGLMLWCIQEKLPLDFVSWHEYFQSAEIIAKEADTFREYLREFPELEKKVKSFMITEWNEAWWPDRPHDHEIGAAWCADGMIRAMIPNKIDKPCLFYVKQGDMSFRGDWSILMESNRPKPTYNVARMFNTLRGKWVGVSGGTDDIGAIAAFDDRTNRLAVIVVNFRFRHASRRHVRLNISNLPPKLANGEWQEWTVDSNHSNVFIDANRCELEMTGSGETGNSAFKYNKSMLANSVVMLELRNEIDDN